MNEYMKPTVLLNEDLSEGVYAASGDNCIQVSSWYDNTDGTNIHRLVFKLVHSGHQSYGQTVTATLSTDVTIVETPGDVTGSVSGNVVTLTRNNQLNDTGITEIWVKFSAATQPTVLSATATCVH